MNRIIAHDLTQLPGEHFLQTHSTNPLLRTGTLDHAIARYFANLVQHDSLFSVTPVQTRFYDAQAQPINHDPDQLIRTQDLEPMYEENSNFYVFSRSSFAAARDQRIGLRPAIYEMNKLEAVDIDDPEDFILAELLNSKKEHIWA
jgi:N-acylneuraminate cytidylyltransferase